ncbi:MAG TPA: CpsD/CapB family tyrosine-protein kinase [Bryobacteraceae bacterium]|nr:CpsD/CapB family tyrosine-protein kinase [Bryobacteraceae bacterium]
MSRVHDALRRAEQLAAQSAASTPAPPAATQAVATEDGSVSVGTVVAATPVAPARRVSPTPELLTKIRQIPFTPSPDAHLINLYKASDAPAEEFRSLRTRLNHLQSLQPLHTVVITSPSPAEGKSFAAANIAITQAQLSGNRTLLIDCDFRRPIIHSFFQTDRSPGLTDYIQGTATLDDCLRRIEESELYILPAGSAVVNPLELLNRIEMKQLMDQLSTVFNWVLLDSPPLLFAADANLLSTLSSGTVLVVRIGSTTVDSITRAMQSLCHNNVLGIVANGARRGELYSKYTYYHSYYYTGPEDTPAEQQEAPKQA